MLQLPSPAPPVPLEPIFDYLNWILGNNVPAPTLPNLPVTIRSSTHNPAKSRYIQTSSLPENFLQLSALFDEFPGNFWKNTLVQLHKTYPLDTNTPQQRLALLKPFMHLDFILLATTTKRPSHVILSLPDYVKVTWSSKYLSLTIPTDKMEPVYRQIAAGTHDRSIVCPWDSTTKLYYDGICYKILYLPGKHSGAHAATLFLRSACQLIPRLFREASPLRRMLL
jgi:hypothetical protein